MADTGKSLNDILNSLSGFGSSSGTLGDIAITGEKSRVLPLVDYADLSKHVFFGDAKRKFNNAIKRIRMEYPIGLSANDVASLSATNVFSVDKWKKEATGYELFLLDKLSLSGTITASATNQSGENTELEWIRRNEFNEITGSQTAIVNSLSAIIVDFEEQKINIVDQISGSSNDGLVISATAEKEVTRHAKLQDLLPENLFIGDDNEILERLLSVFGDLLDNIKVYIDQIPYIKKLSYDDIDRIPDKFMPVFAESIGIKLYETSTNSDLAKYLVSSTTGMTQEAITAEVWKRILKNIVSILKAKGTKDALQSIASIYGVNDRILKVDEWSILKNPVKTTMEDYEDIPTLYSSGDVYAQVSTGTVSAFDFGSSANFTIEARLSATSAQEHQIVNHPLYLIKLDASGQLQFVDKANSLTASTDQSSISSFIQRRDNFTNFIVQRNDDNINLWTMVLSGSGSANKDIVYMTSGTSGGFRDSNFDSSGGASAFGTYFPVSGNFDGYIHELRVWDVPLHENDLKEHTNNFLSTSFIHSTASNSATYGSLVAHYKLRENVILTGGYNFIVDSTTGSNSANPINFQATKRYRVFPNMKRYVSWFPTSLAIDNEKVRSEDVSKDINDTGYISFSMNPVNAVNKDIRNVIENINISDYLGDPEDLYLPSYRNNFKTVLEDIVTRYNGQDIVDLNTFIDAMGNFNDVLGGLFSFSKQFLPARTNLLSEGIVVEPHILQRPKNQREYFGTNKITATAYGISNHYHYSDSGVTGATTGTFQGFKYSSPQTILNDSSPTAQRNVPLLTTSSTISRPKFSPTRVGRFNALNVEPSNPESTELEITLSRLDVSPTASPSAHNGYIAGRIRLLRNGKSIISTKPAIRFDFPSSADGTNYFVAQIGDIDNGKGRSIGGKEIGFSTKIESKDVQINLQLPTIIRSLSSDTQSLSGSIGIVPIRITNLFNNNTQVVRVAITNDNNLVTQIANQGGVKIRS